jgi:hypothetical protein
MGMGGVTKFIDWNIRGILLCIYGPLGRIAYAIYTYIDRVQFFRKRLRIHVYCSQELSDFKILAF